MAKAKADRGGVSGSLIERAYLAKRERTWHRAQAEQPCA